MKKRKGQRFFWALGLALSLVLCGGVTVLAAQAAGSEAGYTELSQLANGRVGVQTGSIYDAMTAELLPEAKVEYYNTHTDMAVDVINGRLDGFLMGEPLARYMQNEFPEIRFLDEYVDSSNYAYAFAKNEEGERLGSAVDVFLEKIKRDGTLEEIDEKWFTGPDEERTVDYGSLTGENGTLKVAVTATNAPFTYMKDGELVGYDLDILARFCQEQGMDMEISDMEFAAIIPGVTTGKYDVGAACIAITQERAQSVHFSQPNYEGGVVMVVKNEAAAENKSFAEKIGESFRKTFVVEQRWKLIVRGIGVTVVISLSSALLGSILGFGICLMRRSKHRLLSAAALVYIRVIQGTPTVVLLMILYYLVFGGVDIQAIWVAIIGFSINFGAYVSEIIRTGIEAVDKGQTEAAWAIGFSKKDAFLKIVMPQAARHFLPVYRGEFISMVKMTSVVGYIAIQDLTKMSDIIRSRTYEAFFPLITTAILYFLLAYLLTRILTLVERRVTPDRKKRMVKGVKP